MESLTKGSMHSSMNASINASIISPHDVRSSTEDILMKENKRPSTNGKQTSNIHMETTHDHPSLDNGWSVRSNLLLIIWLGRTMKLLMLHHKRLRRCQWGYWFIGTIHVIVSSCIGSVSFLLLLARSLTNQSVGTAIGISISTVTLTTVTSVWLFLNLKNKISSSSYAISKFSKLVRELEMVIYSDTEQRPDSGAFLQRVSDKYFKYMKSTDIVEESIEVEWKARICDAAKLSSVDQELHIQQTDIQSDGTIVISEQVLHDLKKAQEIKERRKHSRRELSVDRNTIESNNTTTSSNTDNGGSSPTDNGSPSVPSSTSNSNTQSKSDDD